MDSTSPTYGNHDFNGADGLAIPDVKGTNNEAEDGEEEEEEEEDGGTTEGCLTEEDDDMDETLEGNSGNHQNNPGSMHPSDGSGGVAASMGKSGATRNAKSGVGSGKVF